jgi:bifunctional non-homologous end joining protein LigD
MSTSKKSKKSNNHTVPGARRSAMPGMIKPMLATLVDEPFSDPEWIYESKWDGVRAVCYIKDGQARFVSRNEKEMGFRYPELSGIADFIEADQCILDGEIVALDEAGKPSFQLLQSRLGLKDEQEIERLSKELPAVYYAFDLLYHDGYDIKPAALIDRKSLLKRIIRRNKRLRYSSHIAGKGIEFYNEAARAGLEGIMAKHKLSAYLEDRSSEWLKVKTVLRQEVVIGGYTDPRGTRPLFGALVVGLYRGNKLHYVGHVGGGFNRDTLKQVYKLMQPLKTDKPCFVEQPAVNEPVHWLKPRLVCEVKFAEWTADNRLRQPIFMGLRDDKKPTQCKFEKSRAAKIVVARVDKEEEQKTARKRKL